MEIPPSNFMSRDADGFMDKIVDLMPDDDEPVIGPPGSSNTVMVPIKYIGARDRHTDRVAGTGLAWNKNETQLVPDHQAQVLLQYPDTWIFDAEYLERQTGKATAVGMVPVVIYVTNEDYTALSEGIAEIAVQRITPEQKPQISLNEEIAALDRDGLLAYAQAHGVRIDRTLNTRRLRIALLKALAGDPQDAL